MDTQTIPRTEQGLCLAISVEEAAHALSVTRQHIYSLFKIGDLKSFKSGKRRLVRVSELERYIDDRET